MNLKLKKLTPWFVTAGFIILSILYFGYHGLNTFSLYLLGDKNPDKYFTPWCLMWWPYVISHGLNPFVTYVAWFPNGFDLAKTTSMPGLALLGLPVTLTLGPIVAYNVLLLLAPGLAAGTMFILCRYITQATLPALLGAYFYGFSSFVIDHTCSQLHLTGGIFLLPLLVYFSLRLINSELSIKKFIMLTALCGTLLFFIALETFTLFFLGGALAFCLSYVLMKSERIKLRRLVIPTMISYVLVGILALPYLYYFFVNVNGAHIFHGHFDNDLLSFIVPTPLFLISNHAIVPLAKMDQAWFAEQNSYLGIPFFLILVLFWKQFWEQSYGKMLIWLFTITFMLSLGAKLSVAGHRLLLFPWHGFFGLPIFREIMYTRLGLLLSFYVAIITALWLRYGTSKFILRYCLVLLAILFIFPSFHKNLRTKMDTAQNGPPFFANSLYKNYIHAGENVMIIPFGRRFPVAFWQAKSNFYYRMPDDVVGANQSDQFSDPATTKSLAFDRPYFITTNELSDYIIKHQVDVVLVLGKDYKHWQPLFSDLKVPKMTIQEVGGVVLFRVVK